MDSDYVAGSKLAREHVEKGRLQPDVFTGRTDSFERGYSDSWATQMLRRELARDQKALVAE